MSFALFIVCLIIIALCLIAASVPAIVGAAGKRKIIKPVEYYAPRGASPIDVMLMYYGAFSEPHELFNPLVLYWAQRGFITISEDCKRGLILTKLKDLEPPIYRDGFNPKTFKLEKKLFNFIFGASDVFYTLVALKAYNVVLKSFVTAVQAEVQKACKQPQCSRCETACKVLGLAMLGAISLISGIMENSTNSLLMIFPFFGFGFAGFLVCPIRVHGDMGAYFITFFFSLVCCIPFFAAIAGVGTYSRIVLFAVTAVSAIIIFYLSWHCDLRTKEQLKYYARVCGFKNFLVLAEIQKLEALVEENQQYFYEILPYCYILKITDKLKAKFDRISTDGPAWYLGELRDTLMF